MIRIETYFDKNDIKMHLFNNDNHEYYINGEKAYELIKQFYDGKLLNFQDNDKDALFVFNNCELILKEYEKIFRSDKFKDLFSPIYFKAKDFLELQKISKLKKRKVTRKNKYVKVGIIALGITACILSNANTKAAEKKLGQPKAQDQIVSLNDNTITDDYSKPFESLNEEQAEIINEQNDSYVELEIPNEVEDIELPSNETKENFSFDSQDNNEVILNDTNYEYVSLNFTDRTSADKAKYTEENYRSVIEKYAKMYGIDPNLMLAIATQESGDHDNFLDSGPAIGLMQIEKSVWENGGSLTAYNFDTNSWETITLTPDDYNNFIYNLRDLDYNVKIGCMMFQQSLVYMDYNVLAALQCYNMGYGNMQKILDNYCIDTGLTQKQVLDNQYDDGWLYYRNYIPAGDANYIEHVLSYCGKEYTIQVVKPDGDVINVNVGGNNLDKVR